MRVRILLLALMVHQSWTHPSYSYGSPADDVSTTPFTQNDNPERDGESSKRIIGSSVVTSVSVILNGNEPEYTDALGMKVPKPQVPHLQVASPINLLNPDRYEFYTFDDNGELVKRLMTMEEIQSIVANGDGDGPTIIHSAPINDRDPEKNVQDIVKSVQNVLNREVESNKNASDIQPILDTPDVSSSWSMILPAIFGNTGGDIFPQNKPQQVVMTPDSDVVEATTKATGNKRKPSSKPKPQKKKNGNRRKTTTKRVSTTTPIPEPEVEVTERVETTTRKVFINNQEVVATTETGENSSKKQPGVHGKPAAAQGGTKRPPVKPKKTKRPATSTTTTTTTTTPEPVTEQPTTPEPTTTTTTTTTTTPAPTTTEAVTTTPAPTSTAAPVTTPAPTPTDSPAVVVAEDTATKVKPPQKKRKKPARRPSTTAAPLDVTTDRHIGHYHKRKHTTTRPHVHDTKYKPSTTPAPTTTTTTTTTPVPTTTTTTTTTTTPAPTTTTTTTTTPEPTTSEPTTSEPTQFTFAAYRPTPSTSTTNSYVTHRPQTTSTTTSTTPAPTTTTTTTTTPAPTTTTTTTTTTPAPTTTTTTTTPPPSTSTTASYYQPTTTTSKRPFYAPSLMQQQLFVDYALSAEDFSPSLKKEPIPMPGKLTEKEEDLNTKLSFDQILQSLKEESATDDELIASGSEEVQMPARLPPNTYPDADHFEAVNETPSPIRDLPTLASTIFHNYDDLDELTSRPITQGKPLDSYESLETLLPSDSKKEQEEEVEEEGPLVIITSRPQHYTSSKPLAASLTEATTASYEPEATTIQAEEEDRSEETIANEESAHVVKFEPLYADVSDPVVTTFTSTTPEPAPSTTEDYTSDEDATDLPTTMAPMDTIMQKIDAIISMSLKTNGTLEMNNGQSHIKQTLPQITTMTMKDFKTQAATVASILEDNNTSQSSETTAMNSSETKDEIEFLLSDVINQMTQSQQPPIPTTTVPNIVAAQPQPAATNDAETEQEEDGHRLSNFAQINPALQIAAAGLHKRPEKQPIVDEPIDVATSAPEADAQDGADSSDTAATTAIPESDKESNYGQTSQDNEDDAVSLENTARPLEENQEKEEVEEEEATTIKAAVEASTEAVYQTTQREYTSSEEISKEELSSEEKSESNTTAKPDSLNGDSTEEDGSEPMIEVTSAPEVVEEEKSTEIPGETAVVFSDSDMEESYETPEFTTIVPALQTASHLLEGEDPYVKLGEIGAKPTVQSLAQMIYGQNTKPEDQQPASEPEKLDEISEEAAEKGKIDENQAIQEADILPKIEDSESAEPQLLTETKASDEQTTSQPEEAEPTPELLPNIDDSDSAVPILLATTEVSEEATTILPQEDNAIEDFTGIPEMITAVQPAKKPMMNMAQVALEQALLYATKVPLDFEEDRFTTTESVADVPTTQEPEQELPQLIETTPAPAVTEEKTSSTQAPSSTAPTKKVLNTLKPVSYFNKQSSLIIPEKFAAFQAAQQRPVVRPASLSNLKMPQSSATRQPVKLDPSPVGFLGLEASTTGLDEDLQSFAQLCNELAFTYWRSITSEKISSARSLVLSPFALTSMLSMVFLGARGSTSGEMNEVLKLDDMVTFNPHLVFKNVTDSVEKAPDSEISSSAFVREAFSDRSNGKILQFFKEKTQQFYSGHVEEVNFHVVNDIIRRRTNLLVKRHTMGKVQEYLRTNSVWVSGPLATISANLFQTDCSRASNNDRDGEMFFQVHPSIRQRRLVPVPAVLFKSGFTAGYEPNLDATVAAFGRTFDTVSTIYVMPGQQGPIAPSDSLDLLEKKLIETAFTKHAWKDLLGSLMDRPGLEIQLPRFSHRSFVNASMGLQKMGLKGLFKADLADLRGLTGLAAKDIYLSDMIQINTFSTCAEDKIGEHHHVEMYPAPPIRKRNKDMRESDDDDSSESVIDFGSIVQESAMARAFYDDLLDPKFLELPLPLRPRQARIPDAPRLRFDRPFLYFVRHNPTGMILFMGRFNPRLLP